VNHHQPFDPASLRWMAATRLLLAPQPAIDARPKKKSPSNLQCLADSASRACIAAATGAATSTGCATAEQRGTAPAPTRRRPAAAQPRVRPAPASLGRPSTQQRRISPTHQLTKRRQASEAVPAEKMVALDLARSPAEDEAAGQGDGAGRRPRRRR